MKIKIYQINSKRDPGMAKFMGLARLKAPVDPASYDEVFSGDVDCMNLEDVFAKFTSSVPWTFPVRLGRGAYGGWRFLL